MEFIMGMPEMISMEMHDEIVTQMRNLMNLYFLRVQELVEDGKYEQAILECQKHIV
jgi:hypothetical protein